jgi:flagellar biogenesis protein FliO
MKVRPHFGLTFLMLVLVTGTAEAAGIATNGPALPTLPPDNLLETLLRITGAFVLVIAVFVFGAWFLRKSRFLSLYQGSQAQLKVLESKSLGYRSTLLVVGYYHHRFLVAVTATGVNLLSPLPDAQKTESAPPQQTFSEHLNALQDRKA